MLILEMFLYIFNFPLLAGIGSCYLLGAFLGMKALVSNCYRKNIFNILCNRNIFDVAVWYVAVVSVSLIAVMVHETYDLSFTMTMINQGLQIIIGIFLYADFCSNKKENEAVKYLIVAFVIQSIIQIVSFAFPTIYELLNVFRETSTVEIGESRYLGTRGLAIAGGGFFSLSSAYSVFFVLLAEYRTSFKKNKAITCLVLGVLLFGALSAGRTTLVGVSAAIGVLLLDKFDWLFKLNHIKRFSLKNKISKKTFVVWSFAICVLLTCVLVALNFDVRYSLSGEIKEKIGYFTRYAFELFYNLQNGYGFTTSSTDVLSSMYFPISFKTFIVGDGWYTSETGGYYMSTDAGYMRNLLFFGIIGALVLLAYQLQFFKYKQSGKRKMVSVVLIFLLLVLHVKGDVIGFLQITQRMLTIRMLEQLTFKNEARFDKVKVE